MEIIYSMIINVNLLLTRGLVLPSNYVDPWDWNLHQIYWRRWNNFTSGYNKWSSTPLQPQNSILKQGGYSIEHMINMAKQIINISSYFSLHILPLVVLTLISSRLYSAYINLTFAWRNWAEGPFFCLQIYRAILELTELN